MGSMTEEHSARTGKAARAVFVACSNLDTHLHLAVFFAWTTRGNGRGYRFCRFDSRHQTMTEDRNEYTPFFELALSSAG